MPSSERNETIFGLTEKEVKFLLMSLKCVEDHSNRRFMNCAKLARLTGYTAPQAYQLYVAHLMPKVMALPPINLICDDNDQKDANTTKANVVRASTSAAKNNGKTGTGQDSKKEENKAEEDYNGISDGMDGVAGDPEDEEELEALGSAYAWDV
ncbi:hypothetical protein J7T55_011379 [Diaporthe amygdali]|uniref:uncharacterized protein n=1 Tax=Phomopsis amygdali TaxID=1214568 RepID=UPI0022FF24E2|nr:uncharacterized protein J7T55_011379 [Diaporthe amygdali]KAJ0122918.1 hypothetical protein J7T55_011379 [Diaporthe amygdali]